MKWRDYDVTLYTTIDGKACRVRALSCADAVWRAEHRYGIPPCMIESVSSVDDAGRFTLYRGEAVANGSVPLP